MPNRFCIVIILVVCLIWGCGSPKYIYDTQSKERQAELNKNRSGNVFTDVGITLASFIFSAAVDADFTYLPQGREFKKLKLINPSADTMYVNMLTDVYWDEYDYCDFMDIRIPPKKKTKILVPVDATYHLYFSNTKQPDDDELIQIYTGNLKRIAVYPGLTGPEAAIIDGDF